MSFQGPAAAGLKPALLYYSIQGVPVGSGPTQITIFQHDFKDFFYRYYVFHFRLNVFIMVRTIQEMSLINLLFN